MKATGIVRRIDDLGRVVIPKEIRRTLRINVGAPLEIFTDREGEIVLKKYSPIGEMTDIAKQYVDSLSRVLTHTVLIADRDQVVAASGAGKSMQGKNVSHSLENLVEERETIVASRKDRKFVKITDDMTEDYEMQVIVPIVCEGDVIGSVAILSKDENKVLGETELKLAQTAAGFLGRQMEQS